MTDPNDAVYPSSNPIPKRDWHPADVKLYEQYAAPGLTKREYFAAMALRGAIEWRDSNTKPEEFNVGLLAKDCILVADALIAALSKPAQETKGASE